MAPSAAIRCAPTLFHSDVDDEIHLDPVHHRRRQHQPAAVAAPRRRARRHVAGCRRPSLSAGYAYTEAKFLEGVLPGSPFAIGTDMPIAGKTVPLVPEHKLNVALRLGHPAAHAALGRAHRRQRAVPRQRRAEHAEPDSGVLTVVDLKLAQRFSWGRLSLAVNNLFDQDYYTYAVRSAVHRRTGTRSIRCRDARVSLTAELYVPSGFEVL